VKITALIRRLRLIGSMMKKNVNAIMTAILAPIDLVSSGSKARATMLKKAERVIIILATIT
jgi:ribosomal 50S subunit-associated protein YjgA (DUF615 family)